MARLTANAVLDVKGIAKAIERRSAAGVAKRAELLGVQMERIIANMIDSELGPSSGRSRDRGMVPMRDINWEHEVDNPGELPISVTLFSPDIESGPTRGKFAALNFGSKPHTIRRDAGLSFTTTAGAKGGAGRSIVTSPISHPGTTGHQWLARVGPVARGRAAGRFL